MPGSPGHLTRRFFDVVLARPLSPAERADVGAWLTQRESDLFFAQSNPDQRHAYSAAASVLSGGTVDRSLVRAAMLHDVGKRHARLGVLGRVLASLLILARAPLSARFAAYRDHGPVGAAEMQALGSEALVVDFARHHHGDRPTSIDPEAWQVLWQADHLPKPGTVGRPE